MLKAGQIKGLTKRGTYPDRDGLYLSVSKTGTQSWIYRYQMVGLNSTKQMVTKRREMGLGSTKQVTLAQARTLAGDARTLHKSGTDPIKARNEARQAAAAAPDVMTFQACVDAYIAVKEVDWSNAKHAAQWRNTLKNYAGPVIGDMDVALVDVNHVLAIVEPIWSRRNETASRVRGRIEKVLGWAKVKGYRDRNIANPAIWRDNLDVLLPKRKPAKHHPAMPYAALPGFMALLGDKDTAGSAALQFTILTTGRTSEILEMTWDEVDLDAATWTVPAARMKMKREHRVPLSAPAITLLRGLVRRGEYVFPGRKHKRPLSNNTMRKLLMETHPALTVHGMRSTFRDWCAEQTNFPDLVAEKSLAHGEKNATVAAYRRADMLDKRRLLMDAWGSYATGGSSNVVALPVARGVGS